MDGEFVAVDEVAVESGDAVEVSFGEEFLLRLFNPPTRPPMSAPISTRLIIRIHKRLFLPSNRSPCGLSGEYCSASP